jgi:hypothetical protein
LGPLAKHTKVLVTAVLHFIDDWNGEQAQVSVDGEVKWLKSVTKTPDSIDLCGGTDFKEAAYNVPVLFEVPHTASSLKLSFKTTLAPGTDPCLSSLGIDNV